MESKSQMDFTEPEKVPLNDCENAAAMVDSDGTDLDHNAEKCSDQGPSDSGSSSSESRYQEREKWGSKFEFILACVGFAVAYGNLMRFPYLCMRNGGGAFLIPFFTFMVLLGFPLYYLEVCLGQFSGSSPLFVWRIVPMLKGLGWLMVLISGIVCWYYNTIIAWVLFYLVNSFYPKLPWSTCDNDWNTAYCLPSDPESREALELQNNQSLLVHIGNFSGVFNESTAGMDLDASNITGLETIVRNTSSAKEFWQRRVLNMSSGIDEPGYVQWHLVVSLMAAWLLVFLCLIKGVKSVGKVVYVTALLPYVLLFAFLIRGLTLPGSGDGIMFFLTPKFSRLLSTQVWIEAAVQVFYSLGPIWGGVITMSSYNKFRNNVLCDTIIACLADGVSSFLAGFVVFSIIGYMAHELKQPIEEVATQGPGLMFIAYPEAISKMPVPHLWAVLFFIMLITVGLDTQFGMFETLSSGIVDAFPEKLGRRKTLVTALIACAMFLLGLPYTTRAGIYIYNLVDWYSSSVCMQVGGLLELVAVGWFYDWYSSSVCMQVGGLLELVAVGWFYGAERFSNDVVFMLGYPLPLIVRLCWCIISPAIFFVILVIMMVTYQDVTYSDYVYPQHSVVIGYISAMVPILPLPICFIIGLLSTSGSFRQRMKALCRPQNWRPSDQKLWGVYEEMEQPRVTSIIQYVRITLFGEPGGVARVVTSQEEMERLS